MAYVLTSVLNLLVYGAHIFFHFLSILVVAVVTPGTLGLLSSLGVHPRFTVGGSILPWEGGGAVGSDL